LLIAIDISKASLLVGSDPAVSQIVVSEKSSFTIKAVKQIGYYKHPEIEQLPDTFTKEEAIVLQIMLGELKNYKKTSYG
jgi:hypothetical protein